MKMEIRQTARRISREMDEVLASAPFAAGNRALADEIYAYLVDLLAQSILVDLAGQRDEGAIDDAGYAAALATFAHECRAVGLTGPL
jgi:hypothetical protein